MIKDLTQKVDKICTFPRIKRGEVYQILRDCYNEGRMAEKERTKKLQKLYTKFNEKTLFTITQNSH
jgi:hypothetical protein